MYIPRHRTSDAIVLADVCIHTSQRAETRTVQEEDERHRPDHLLQLGTSDRPPTNDPAECAFQSPEPLALRADDAGTEVDDCPECFRDVGGLHYLMREKTIGVQCKGERLPHRVCLLSNKGHVMTVVGIDHHRLVSVIGEHGRRPTFHNEGIEAKSFVKAIV